jgi:predicted AAA+ superfamily ATPase
MDFSLLCGMKFRKEFALLLEVLEEFPVVAIVGSRQCGKTTMAKMVDGHVDKPSLYLDLELSSDLAKLDEAELFLKSHEDKLIIIDEVQHKPDLFALLRALSDQHQTNGRFLILGSASPQLLKQTSEALTGRIYYLEMSPFSLLEVEGEKPIRDHWFLGGYPKSFLARTVAASQRWMTNYVKNYVERDLPDLGLDVSALALEKFWRIIASYHGGIWNSSKIGALMNLSNQTISRYLYFLEEAYLVHSLAPYATNDLKRIVKTPKIYVRDSGLYHFLAYVKTADQLQGDIKLGASWEGYVVEQIRIVAKGKFDLFYYRTHNGAECDLVLVRDGKPLYGLEIKYSSRPSISRGYYQSIQDLGTTENYVVIPEGEVYPVDAKVKGIGILHFLKLIEKQ